MNISNLNLLDNIMSKEDCLGLIDLALASKLRQIIEKLETHYFVDVLDLFSKATQLYQCLSAFVETQKLSENEYKSMAMYIGVRDGLCDLLAGRKSLEPKDDIDGVIEEGRKEIRIIPGRIEK